MYRQAWPSVRMPRVWKKRCHISSPRGDLCGGCYKFPGFLLTWARGGKSPNSENGAQSFPAVAGDGARRSRLSRCRRKGRRIPASCCLVSSRRASARCSSCWFRLSWSCPVQLRGHGWSSVVCRSWSSYTGVAARWGTGRESSPPLCRILSPPGPRTSSSPSSPLEVFFLADADAPACSSVNPFQYLSLILGLAWTFLVWCAQSGWERRWRSASGASSSYSWNSLALSGEKLDFSRHQILFR